MSRVKWTDRQFDFNFPVELYPEMIERVRGTPARLEDLLRTVPAELRTRQEDGRWSMQENAADMSNRKTYEANHNDVNLDVILNEFRKQRRRISSRLDQLDAEAFGRIALHPRLKVQMRLVDMLYFQAEHDDYHLARISELRKSHK
jgi:DinB superfamily